MSEITIRVIERDPDPLPPHHLPQRSPTAAEAPDWRRVPHSPSPFRLIGVIEGGKQ